MIISIMLGIIVIINMVQVLMLIVRGGKEQNIYQVLIFITGLVCNIGYFTLAISKSIDMAIVCNNITYLGGVFLPLCVLLRTADLCRIRLSNGLVASLTSFSVIVLMLVFTTGYSDIYYSNVSIEKVYGATRMVKDYGPAHNTYRVLLALYLIVTVGVVVNAFKSRKNFTKRTVFTMVANLLIPCAVYVAERSFNCPVELLPFAYTFSFGLFLNSVGRMKMYDMSSSIAGAHEKLDEYGYITFDLNKKLMNDNYVARKYFPELYEVEIDENAKKDESVFYREIVEWMDLKKNEESKEKKVVIKDRIIKCTVRRIYQGYKKKVIGYSIEIVDITKEENYIRLLNDYGANLAKEVEKKTEHIRNMQNSIITGMATMVESRDNSTGGHIMRTSECVRVFAGALKWKMPELTVHFLKDVVKAAPMHDLGKIAVDDRILRKPGSFTDEEYEIMKSHSAEGARIVGEVLAEVQDEQFKQIAINVAHYHHEKWDGSGYPEGKKGNEIPVEARIMAFADVFDTLVSKRYYKEAYSYEKAFGIIEESLGTHFDPELGKVFLECREELEKLYDDISE